MRDQDPQTGRFLTGNSGSGRPKGSRNKLGENFLEALAQDFAEHGQLAIVECREPPLDVCGECLIRTATTDGIVMLTFTLLDGLREVVMSFLPKRMQPGFAA